MMENQWIYRAMKEWDDSHDLAIKQRITRIVKERLDLYVVYDQVIFINKESRRWQKEQPPQYLTKSELLADWDVQIPDILNAKHNIVIEIDGDVHWKNRKAVKNTNRRNQNYEMAGLRLVWLFTSECDCTDDELYGKIMRQLSKPRGISLP